MKKTYYLLLLIATVFSCKNDTKTDEKLNVVTTTTMITDLVKNIGGDAINVQGLMGSGVDPHLYKASEGDVNKLANADIIFFNGLHLEGKLVDVFEKMESQGITTIALAEKIHENGLISSENFASNYDPHVWFNIEHFKEFTKHVTNTLSQQDPKNKDFFKSNEKTYMSKLDKLEEDIKETVNSLPKENRILVTAHDAFNYFGRTYGFKVVGLQGLSTVTEAGVQDVQKLASFIIDHKVKAIFVESSVPKRTIEALQKAVKSKDYEVIIGGTLYSDALGNAGTPEGTYLGMYRYNIKTIVKALL